ncbi:hypothetical protein ABGV42_00280 [Paenibacillus pabuli]|uniref:hypothetical protein n=1 Tax=Paenibacillus pabuli TaxID=1472 RepID=UPI0032428864
MTIKPIAVHNGKTNGEIGEHNPISVFNRLLGQLDQVSNELCLYEYIGDSINVYYDQRFYLSIIQEKGHNTGIAYFVGWMYDFETAAELVGFLITEGYFKTEYMSNIQDQIYNFNFVKYQ